MTYMVHLGIDYLGVMHVIGTIKLHLGSTCSARAEEAAGTCNAHAFLVISRATHVKCLTYNASTRHLSNPPCIQSTDKPAKQIPISSRW